MGNSSLQSTTISYRQWCQKRSLQLTGHYLQSLHVSNPGAPLVQHKWCSLCREWNVHPSAYEATALPMLHLMAAQAIRYDHYFSQLDIIIMQFCGVHIQLSNDMFFFIVCSLFMLWRQHCIYNNTCAPWPTMRLAGVLHSNNIYTADSRCTAGVICCSEGTDQLC